MPISKLLAWIERLEVVDPPWAIIEDSTIEVADPPEGAPPFDGVADSKFGKEQPKMMNPLQIIRQLYHNEIKVEERRWFSKKVMVLSLLNFTVMKIEVTLYYYA